MNVTPPGRDGSEGGGDLVLGRQVLVVVIIVALAAVVLAVGPARALHPRGTFVKYVEATTHPDNAREQDYSPLYLGLFRALYPGGGRSLVRAVQVVLFAVTCVCVSLAVGLQNGWIWGLMAGLVAASYRPFLVYVGVLEPESLLLFLLAGAVASGVWARRVLRADLNPDERRWPWRALVVLSLILLALAATTRPQYVLLIPVWTLWLAGASPRLRVKVLVWGAVGACLIVAPAAILQLAHHGDLSVMDPGTVFYEGNGPQSHSGTYVVPELVRVLQRGSGCADCAHVEYRRVASVVAGRRLSRTEANRYWVSLALASFRADPARGCRRLMSKTVLAIAPYELQGLLNAAELDRSLRRVLPWGFLPLLVAAISLIPAIWRKRAALLGPLALIVLAWTTQVVFYPSARQRLPLALAVLMIVGSSVRTLPRRRLRSAVLLGLGLLVGTGVTWWSAPVAAYDEAQVDLWFGAAPPGPGARAAEAFDGRGWRPETTRVAEALALMRSAGSQVDGIGLAGALRQCLDEGARFPAWMRGRAAHGLARIALSEGRLSAARQWASVAVRQDPGFLPGVALARLLTLGRCPRPSEPAPAVAGSDPLSTRFALAMEARVTYGPACAGSVMAPLLVSFPDLDRALQGRR